MKMTIIFSEKVTPSTLARIKKSEAFVAFITKAFVARPEKRYAECKMAEKLNKPMYAIVEKGIDWSSFQKFGWRKIYYYEIKPSESIVKDIEKDLKWFKQIRSM